MSQSIDGGHGAIAPLPTLHILPSPRQPFPGACIMSNESSLSSAELNNRIRILEDNIRQLIEQAAAASGEQNESRIADRLSQQNEELERLTRERDARSKK
jgi:uncharacterized small protein (DUF1192 family)